MTGWTIADIKSWMVSKEEIRNIMRGNVTNYITDLILWLPGGKKEVVRLTGTSVADYGRRQAFCEGVKWGQKHPNLKETT